MQVKVKLIDRNLIRAFGGVVQMMNVSKAQRFVAQGKAIIDEHDKNEIDNIKMEKGPPFHKAIFQAPEDKISESFEVNRYPGPGDKLFSITKRRK